jgi:hypothetical protein
MEKIGGLMGFEMMRFCGKVVLKKKAGCSVLQKVEILRQSGTGDNWLVFCASK